MAEQNIHLRELTASDVTKDYVGWLNDKTTNRYLESRFVEHTLEGTKVYVSNLQKSENDYLYGIFLNDNHVGNVKIGSIDSVHKRGDIGLLIGKEYWGKGIGKKSIALAQKIAFEDLNLNKLTAGVYEPNSNSLKAFISNGWRMVGKYTKHAMFEDGFCDCYIIEIINPKKDKENTK